MKLLLVIFMFLTSDYDINKISKSNRLKKEAETAFKEKDYATAIEKYTYLIDTLGVNDDKLYLNLAHAYFQKKDSLKASQFYQKLIFQNDNLLKSTALNQLGIISSKMGNKPEALQYLKEAMKANPSNEEARYNYQLLKLQKDEHKDDKNKNNKNDKNKDNKEQQNKEQQNKEQQNKEQQNKEQQNKEQQNKEQQNKEQQNKEQNKPGENKKEKEQLGNVQKKLQQINMSIEQAQKILEAMQNNEIQYLQQNKRKPTKKNDKNKPDW